MLLIKKYFPNIDKLQFEQLGQLYKLYKYWNEKINLISRKDFSYFNERHLLHSLSIAKIINFKNGTQIIDVGTGGGFPGVPLAILFPNVNFFLIESIKKKCNVINSIKEELKLNNVEVINNRAENITITCDFVVNRAVAPIDILWKWMHKNINKLSNNNIPNGIICLKGGDLETELSKINKEIIIWEIAKFFEEDFFKSKKIILVSIASANKEKIPLS